MEKLDEPINRSVIILELEDNKPLIAFSVEYFQEVIYLNPNNIYPIPGGIDPLMGLSLSREKTVPIFNLAQIIYSDHNKIEYGQRRIPLALINYHDLLIGYQVLNIHGFQEIITKTEIDTDLMSQLKQSDIVEGISNIKIEGKDRKLLYVSLDRLLAEDMIVTESKETDRSIDVSNEVVDDIDLDTIDISQFTLPDN